MPKVINVQDSWLFQSLRESRRLQLSLTTGRDFTGVVARFDRYAIVFIAEVPDSQQAEMLIYKSAIAAIIDLGGVRSHEAHDQHRRIPRPVRPAPRTQYIASGRR